MHDRSGLFLADGNYSAAAELKLLMVKHAKGLEREEDEKDNALLWHDGMQQMQVAKYELYNTLPLLTHVTRNQAETPALFANNCYVAAEELNIKKTQNTS